MKNIFLILVLFLPTLAFAECKHDAMVRLGLIWYEVSVTSETNLKRREIIKLLEKKYNFHDVGDIYTKCR